MNPNKPFETKVAYVTGAGSGMGADIALLLAERGAKVSLIGRQLAPLQQVADDIAAHGGDAAVFAGDVSIPDDVERTVAATEEHFGSLDFAVNNAGVSSTFHDLPDLPEAEWNATIGINLSGIFHGLKFQIPAMLRAGGGSIVNVSSVFADRGFARRPAYSASKHAIRGLTRSAAIEWAAQGIRINEIQPGVIAVPRQQSNPEEVARIASGIPIQRVGTGREIATAVAFLLSDDASYITGAHLAVDGGYLS